LPDGHRFRSGLFAWERRVFEDSPSFPRSGRILLGAAGAGRELVALLARGYEVVAFDPCTAFVEAARRVAADSPKATVVEASYADLIRAAETPAKATPLSFITDGLPFDAVVLGWGSLSHVLPSSERLALLRAIRVIADRAPVFTSFSLEPDSSAPRASKGRVRDALRRLFAAMNAPGPSEAGDHFYQDGGFFSNLGSDEIVKLAWGAGYEVVLFEDAPYPHALLVPHASDAVA
jgi:hypothetical protein